MISLPRTPCIYIVGIKCAACLNEGEPNEQRALNEGVPNEQRALNEGVQNEQRALNEGVPNEQRALNEGVSGVRAHREWSKLEYENLSVLPTQSVGTTSTSADTSSMHKT